MVKTCWAKNPYPNLGGDQIWHKSASIHLYLHNLYIELWGTLQPEKPAANWHMCSIGPLAFVTLWCCTKLRPCWGWFTPVCPTPQCACSPCNSPSGGKEEIQFEAKFSHIKFGNLQVAVEQTLTAGTVSTAEFFVGPQNLCLTNCPHLNVVIPLREKNIKSLKNTEKVNQYIPMI